MALKGAKSQLQQEMTYGGVASSRIRPLTRLVGKFSKSKVVPKKNRPNKLFLLPPPPWAPETMIPKDASDLLKDTQHIANLDNWSIKLPLDIRNLSDPKCPRVVS